MKKNTKQKSELKNILTESIERHTNKTFYLLREKEERNSKIGKVINQSLQLENERAKSLENKSKIKQLRKLLLSYEEKNSILSAFVNLALRDNIKRVMYNIYSK